MHQKAETKNFLLTVFIGSDALVKILTKKNPYESNSEGHHESKSQAMLLVLHLKNLN